MHIHLCDGMYECIVLTSLLLVFIFKINNRYLKWNKKKSFFFSVHGNFGDELKLGEWKGYGAVFLRVILMKLDTYLKFCTPLCEINDALERSLLYLRLNWGIFALSESCEHFWNFYTLCVSFVPHS